MVNLFCAVQQLWLFTKSGFESFIETVSIIKSDPPYKDGNVRFISGAGKLTGITMNIEKRQHLPYYCSDKGFTGNIVNRALSSLHGESLDITLTVPLIV